MQVCSGEVRGNNVRVVSFTQGKWRDVSRWNVWNDFNTKPAHLFPLKSCLDCMSTVGQVDGDHTEQGCTRAHTQRQGAVSTRILSPFSQAKLQRLGPRSTHPSLSLLPVYKVFHRWCCKCGTCFVVTYAQRQNSNPWNAFLARWKPALKTNLPCLADECTERQIPRHICWLTGHVSTHIRVQIWNGVADRWVLQSARRRAGRSAVNHAGTITVWIGR